MEAATERPLRGAWLILGLLWAVAILNYLDRIMITTMRGSLVEAIPMTDAQFGLLTSAFLWVYGLLSPLAGFLADRFSRSRIIIGSVLVWSAVTWLTAQADTFEELLFARAMMGISEASYIPAALALITDYHRGTTRSLAVGIHMTGVFIGGGVAGVGGWLAEKYTWHFAFQLFGVAGVVYAFVLFMLLRDAPQRDAPAEMQDRGSRRVTFVAALGALLTRPSYLILLAYWGLLSITGWAVAGWMPSFLTEQFHLSQGKAGLLATGCSQAASLVGVLVGGAWADRWCRADDRGRVFVPIVGLLVAAPAILLVTNVDVLPWALAGLVIFGLTIAFNDANMMPILCQVADERYRATGYGILNLFGCLIGGLSIYAGGVLRDANVNVSVVFRFATIGMAICVVLLLRIAHVIKAGRVSDGRFTTIPNSAGVSVSEAAADL